MADLGGAVKGFAAIDKALAQMPNDVAGDILASSIRKAARPMVADAKARAPKKSGELAKAIRTRLDKKTRTGVTLLIGVFRKKVFWARFMELGTKAHKVRIRKKQALAEAGEVFGFEVEIPAGRPRPFLRPAFDSKGAEAIRILGEETWRRIRKHAKGGR